MNLPHATASELRRAINTDILDAVGLSPASPLRVALRPLFWPPVHLFARVAAEFDQHVAQSGLMDAVRWVLPRFVDGVRAQGTENIPDTGPLVIASNHPGASDGLAIASCLPRDDLKVVVTDRPFFRGLHAASSYLIYTPRDAAGRMSVVREAIRHLRAGGSLLIFAHGHLEPDPEVASGAEVALERWSPSVPLFLRQVPGASLVVTVVSGVLAPSALRHPLTRLREDWQGRQLMAEFVQIAQQVLVWRRYGLVPTVRFGAPLAARDLLAGRDLNAALAAILVRARELLAEI
jgi:1-acyl-sn-glycerol-3-phosphate acyltransferase